MTTLTRTLTAIEDAARDARRGDLGAMSALETYTVLSSGKARTAARKALAESRAEVAERLEFTFAVDAEAPAADGCEFDDVEFSVLVG